MTMDYKTLEKQVASLLENESDMIANMANLSALIYQSLNDVNWAGFYIRQKEELVLGPFQGNIACVRIPIGKGVCGTSALRRETLLVDNVHQFPGHIACDAASNSEIVIPVVVDGETKAVFDIDSPIFKRFTQEDKFGLERIVSTFKSSTKLIF